MQEKPHAACMKDFRGVSLPGVAGITEELQELYGVPCEILRKKMTFILTVHSSIEI